MNSKVHERTARDYIKNTSGLAQFSFVRTSAAILNEMIAADKLETDKIRQELSLLKAGHLFVHQHKDGFYFGCYDGGAKKEAGISTDDDLVYALARRSYLEKRLCMIEQAIYRAEDYLEKCEDIQKHLKRNARLERFSEAGLDLSRILFTKEQNEWIDAPYTPDPFHRENLKYPTENGLLTRSKSEASIGTRFERIGLPYRYDDMVAINRTQNGAPPSRDTYFADFKVPNLSGGITIHEHFGALQITNYADNALRRLNDYRDHTLYELPKRPVCHNEITWSLESDLRDQGLFERMIQHMLLPSFPF